MQAYCFTIMFLVYIYLSFAEFLFNLDDEIGCFFQLPDVFWEYSAVCYMPHFPVYFSAFLEDVFLGFHFCTTVSALDVLFASSFGVFLLVAWMPLSWGWCCNVFYWVSPCIVVFFSLWFLFSSLPIVWSLSSPQSHSRFHPLILCLSLFEGVFLGYL